MFMTITHFITSFAPIGWSLRDVRCTADILTIGVARLRRVMLSKELSP